MAPKQQRTRKSKGLSALSALVLLLGTFASVQGAAIKATTCPKPSNNGTFHPSDHWSTLTPYQSSPGWGVNDTLYSGAPNATSGQACQLIQAHVLHRHGARYPMKADPTKPFQQFVEQHPDLKYTGQFEFLNGWKWKLGTSILLPLGVDELFDSGSEAFHKYGDLVIADLQDKKPLFARTTSMERIKASGIAWLDGFFGKSWWKTYTDLQIQTEDKGFNSTLSPWYACARQTELGKDLDLPEISAFIDHYLQDALSRFNTSFGGGGYLTTQLLFHMQTMCPYETVALGNSSFCGLFNQDEWLNYEYAKDLQEMYVNGPSSQQGRSYGLGWLNEFIRRLQKASYNPSFQTSDNSTLDSSLSTFPLDQRFT